MTPLGHPLCSPYGLALGHVVVHEACSIFLTGEATNLMRKQPQRDFPGWLASPEAKCVKRLWRSGFSLLLRGVFPGPWGLGKKI